MCICGTLILTCGKSQKLIGWRISGQPPEMQLHRVGMWDVDVPDVSTMACYELPNCKWLVLVAGFGAQAFIVSPQLHP